MVIEKLSGTFEYKSNNEIRELSEQYKNHPKVLSAIEKIKKSKIILRRIFFNLETRLAS